jgi:hypothetical protein
MNVNTEMITAERNRYRSECLKLSQQERTPEILNTLTVLNVLVATVNKDGLSIDEINTLTKAGKLVVGFYHE